MPAFEWISFTTDYGSCDGFVAVCHGVIGRLAPAVRVIDVTHQVPPGDIQRGATVLAQTVSDLPTAVHVAVVDPGVGTARRAVALQTPDGLLVGPDNGLLLWAAQTLGGVVAAVELTNRSWFGARVSSTFHGRDIFTPVAARLANGAELTEAGLPLPPAELVQLPTPVVASGPGWLVAEVIAIDRFGNVQLAADRQALDALAAPAQALTVNGAYATRGSTFGDVSAGELVVLVDAANRVAVAAAGGNASATLTVSCGDLLRIHAGGV